MEQGVLVDLTLEWSYLDLSSSRTCKKKPEILQRNKSAIKSYLDPAESFSYKHCRYEVHNHVSSRKEIRWEKSSVYFQHPPWFTHNRSQDDFLLFMHVSDPMTRTAGEKKNRVGNVNGYCGRQIINTDRNRGNRKFLGGAGLWMKLPRKRTTAKSSLNMYPWINLEIGCWSSFL